MVCTLVVNFSRNMANKLKLNDTLNTFYMKWARSKKDAVGNTKLRNYIDEVLKTVGEKSPRFKPKEVILVGSTASGVSAIREQEMDRLVLIDINGEVENVADLHEFAKLKLDRSVQGQWTDCIDADRYLQPRKVAKMFRKSIEEASKSVIDSNPSGYSGIDDPAKEIAVGGDYSVAVPISGVFGPNNWAFGKTKCDIVLEIDFKKFPPTDLPRWLVQPNEEQWPSIATVNKIKNIDGYGLVAKNLHDTSYESLLWQYSVSRAESRILKECPDQLIYKKLLIILKAVRLFEIPETKLEQNPPITSYHMKTIILQEANSYPDPNEWVENKLGERFISAVNRLLTNINIGKLPHFFFPKVNLFKIDPSEMVPRLNEIVKDPITYLEKLIALKKAPFEGQTRV